MRYRTYDSVRLIPGVGPKTVENMERMGITTIGHLLSWFPRRYIDATNPLPLNLVPFDQPAAIRVTIDSVQKKRTSKRNLSYLDVQVSDESDIQLTMRFFNQPYLEAKLVEGSVWTCLGTIERFHGLNLINSPLLLDNPQVVPVYLQTKGVTSRQLQGYIKQVLEGLIIEDEPIPEPLRARENIPGYGESLRLIHQPANLEEVERGKRALAFLETFSFFLGIEQNRQAQVLQTGVEIQTPIDWLKRVVDNLPFTLTAGQKRIVWDCLQEMNSGALMTRLLNGDVGSGKTVVAALLAACVSQSGHKTLVLVPTEILAQQHAQTFRSLLARAGCTVALWTANTKEAADKADIIVGTHALLSDNFAVDNVGFMIIDEQHRFGVKQRALLRDKQQRSPHVLAMTATPIPRTLALVLFADLSVSFLREKPVGRPPIMTEIIAPTRRSIMMERVKSEVAAGHQVFVLCPLIENEIVYDELDNSPTDPNEMRTVTREAERLQKENPELGRIVALHGKLSAKEKARITELIQKGEVDVLVATSVIEVGIDLPKATVIIVENAERFGLAQLHQLRGRVGRGATQSYCYLCPTVGGGPAIERLRVLVESNDGFEIAERDLELRGPGELTGISQSGLPGFQLARLTDLDFLQKVRDITRKYCEEHPDFLLQWQKSQLSKIGVGLE